MADADDVLVRARWRDLPALALVAGQAMARRPFGAPAAWVLGVAGWPLWWVILVLQHPYLWCAPRRALVAIRPPAAPRWPGVRLMLAGPGVLGSLIGLSWTLWRPLFWSAVVSAVVGLVVYAGPYRGRLLAGPTARHLAPPVNVAMAAAARRGSGLLGKTGALLRARHPGSPVELVARDEDLVALYADQLGLTQVTPGRGRMTGVIPR